MRKVTMCLGIRVIITLVILLASFGINAEIARAVGERPKQLDTANDLLEGARVLVDQAIATGDEGPARQALGLAAEIARQLTQASESVREMEETDPAMMTADLAGQTTRFVVYEVAVLSRESDNVQLASECLDVAERLCKLVYTIGFMALERGQPQLATAAVNAANYIRDTIQRVAETAQYISQTSTDPARVDAADDLYDRSQEIQQCLLPDVEGYIAPRRELGDDDDDDCASCV